MSSDNVISARSLGKAYLIYGKPSDRLKQMIWRHRRRFFREFWALRGIDVEIDRGETVGVIGRNGAGKSTLLQLICGNVLPTEGELRVVGRVVALLELGAGFNPEFTGRENAFINASLLGMTDDEIRQRFERIAAFADIGDFMDRPVRMYSSGMQARLAFSVAAHVDPEILIVDEVLAVGDAAFQRKCVQRLYEIRDTGCTILFVSHDPYLVKTICQRALYLRDGRLAASGPAADVADSYVYDLERAEAGATQALQPEQPAPEAAQTTIYMFRIDEVRLEDEHGNVIDEVTSGQTIQVRMRYVAVADELPDEVCFVFNLKRHDEFYVCGTTTLMDGIGPSGAQREGEVMIRFPNFRVLAGEYKWRVAINDNRGVAVLAEASHQCPFRVRDQFQAHGLVDLPREWHLDGRTYRYAYGS